MGALTVAMFMTIDGYTQTVERSLIAPAWAGDMQEHWSGANAHEGQLLLYGRTAFLENSTIWPAAAVDARGPDEHRAFAVTMNALPKVVVSATLTDPGWNATVESGPLPEVIERVKGGFDGEIVAVGGVSLVRSLVASGLVDRYRLLVMPRIAGSGISIFDGEHSPRDLELVSQQTLSTGSVILEYQPDAANNEGMDSGFTRGG
ncbi:MAG: dihydrofolate reductase family protein [Gordonia sp. (in: high G+C Gram-positive bacteria)]|uniref:dihydrofolate reductase family protein n=1 Tax=Gordonia sp. (in: high G+C Gram-positive bacteria) TaxID=84139 RepID=UPI0039E31801